VERTYEDLYLCPEQVRPEPPDNCTPRRLRKCKFEQHAGSYCVTYATRSHAFTHSHAQSVAEPVAHSLAEPNTSGGAWYVCFRERHRERFAAHRWLSAKSGWHADIAFWFAICNRRNAGQQR